MYNLCFIFFVEGGGGISAWTIPTKAPDMKGRIRDPLILRPSLQPRRLDVLLRDGVQWKVTVDRFADLEAQG